MDTYYQNLKDRAGALLQHKRTGVAEVVRTVTTPGATEFDPPTISTTYTDVPAVVVGVGFEYAEANSQIKSTDLSVTTILLPELPALGDKVRVNGQELSIREVSPIPAGEPVALRLIVGV